MLRPASRIRPPTSRLITICLQQECPHPNFKPEVVRDWVAKHGNGVAVIGLVVEDATQAFNLATGVGQNPNEEWATRPNS